MKTKDLIWAVMALSVCACSSENEESQPRIDEGEIQLEMVYPSASTRATDTRFEDKDRIGVFVTAEGETLQMGGNEVNNEQFTYNGTSWTSKRKVYWNSGKHDVYAYYPYGKSINDIENYSFSVQADQNAAADADGLTGYEKSDFLWAGAKSVAASNSAVKMQFAHKLSNVVVKLVKGENFTGDISTDTEVYVHSTVTKASIDLSTGDAAKDDYAGTSSIRCRQVSATEYMACVVPQNITSRRPLVEVVTGGVSYLMEGKISLKQGMRHTITVTLDKSPEQMKIEIGGEIVGW
ncbi:MAG: fimbrillin family protein [Bacteroidaceae bacterium]|nr:fimbrillin family protein [Bacteroidaceae bacterium]